jgi:putative acetyltransferase
MVALPTAAQEGQVVTSPSADIPGVEVRRDPDLASPEVVALIAEHLAGMHGNSPPGHVNALALEGLRAPDVTFWTAWAGGALCGCGALKELDAGSGEVKSMRTRAACLRRGIGQAVLDRIIVTARARGYRHLLLETGTGPAFEAAHALYLRNGFQWSGAFGDYVASDFNVFMALDLPPVDPPRSAPVGLTAEVAALLRESGLPTEDLAENPQLQLLGLREGDRLVGVVGIEPFGDDGLLRSLAVRPDRRTAGLGAVLVGEAERWALARGLGTLYLLTTTAQAFFARRGYEPVPRAEAPAPIAATAQFRGLCPASAAFMRKRLTPAR